MSPCVSALLKNSLPLPRTMSPAWYSPCHCTPPYLSPPPSVYQFWDANKQIFQREERGREGRGGSLKQKHAAPRPSQYGVQDVWSLAWKANAVYSYSHFPSFYKFISLCLLSCQFFCFLHCILRENLWNCSKGIGKMYLTELRVHFVW